MPDKFSSFCESSTDLAVDLSATINHSTCQRKAYQIIKHHTMPNTLAVELLPRSNAWLGKYFGLVVSKDEIAHAIKFLSEAPPFSFLCYQNLDQFLDYPF